MVVSKRYGIEDIYDYDLTEYSDHALTHVNTVSVPTGNLEISYVTMKNTNNRGGGIRYGSDTNNIIDISVNGLAELNGGNWRNNYSSTSYSPQNTEMTIKYTYIDGVHSFYVDDVLKTSFTQSFTKRGWIRIADNDTYIKDTKIREL